MDLWAYWIHNGSRWVCAGTDRKWAADMLGMVRLDKSADRPKRGRAAVTRATMVGRSGQTNVPKD